MKLPSLSRMFGPIPDPLALPPERIETIRMVDRIALAQTGDTVMDVWTAIFEDAPERVELSARHLPSGMQHRVGIALARKGDRLRMVHLDGRLVEVENLDLPGNV
jgi:hypothetical protein